MTINENKISYENNNCINKDNLANKEEIIKDINKNDISSSSNIINNNSDHNSKETYFHIADETDDSSNECSSSTSYSDSCSSYTSDDSYSNYDDESSSSDYNINEMCVFENIKETLNKIKISAIQNNNIINSESLSKLCEIDIQLKEISCEVKDLILLFNNHLNNK
ncbi:expressed protein [Dictyostelium purpureum]|uniref:Expressed protein n=1 Tax=Dictyostelium purpureum TaxID=5786 RepID=F0ZIB9_DICPU|nr:uncharacterized protein DICPUDRAFT_91857 [Dictyostelium purpureum]EGC36296.1 expressed protein [Dictyostelium purpureum]|eukprot:XP_003287174.1 expressed protein [Dictyostelium purpureum]